MERTDFETAARLYQDMIYRIALHHFGAGPDAEDAVQEVFLRLFTWKKPWRKRSVSQEALPEKYRTTLYLFYYEGLSTGKNAAALRVRQTAVTTRLSWAREMLRVQLGEGWNHD